MSGTFPSSPAPSSIAVDSIEPTLVSVTGDLTRQARSRGGQRWSFSVSFPAMERSNFDPIFAFSVKQRGQFETFTFVPKTIGTTRGVTTENPVVKGGKAVGVTSCLVDGLTASTTNIMRAGDFFKFSGHNKVYICTADMTSDGSGDATLSFAPKLSKAVVDNETITINSVPFTVAFAGDVASYATNVTGYYSFDVELVEVP